MFKFLERFVEQTKKQYSGRGKKPVKAAPVIDLSPTKTHKETGLKPHQIRARVRERIASATRKRQLLAGEYRRAG